MDRRFWEKIIPASVLAAGIALAGYFVGGGYTVIQSTQGGSYIVNRFTGGVRKCASGAGYLECASVSSSGSYKTMEQALRERGPAEIPDSPEAMADSAMAAAAAAAAE